LKMCFQLHGSPFDLHLNKKLPPFHSRFRIQKSSPGEFTYEVTLGTKGPSQEITNSLIHETGHLLKFLMMSNAQRAASLSNLRMSRIFGPNFEDYKEELDAWEVGHAWAINNSLEIPKDFEEDMTSSLLTYYQVLPDSEKLQVLRLMNERGRCENETK